MYVIVCRETLPGRNTDTHHLKWTFPVIQLTSYDTLFNHVVIVKTQRVAICPIWGLIMNVSPSTLYTDYK